MEQNYNRPNSLPPFQVQEAESPSVPALHFFDIFFFWNFVFHPSNWNSIGIRPEPVRVSGCVLSVCARNLKRLSLHVLVESRARPSEVSASLPSFVSVCNRRLPRETDGADRKATAEEKHSQPPRGTDEEILADVPM